MFYKDHLKILRLPYTITTIESYNFYIQNLQILIYCGSEAFTDQFIFHNSSRTDYYFPEKIIVSQSYPFDSFGECNKLYKTFSCEIPIHYIITITKRTHLLIHPHNLFIFLLSQLIKIALLQ